MDIRNAAAMDPISHEIWDLKYRFKTDDGTPIDQTIEDSWTRVAHAIASPEAEEVREAWTQSFYGILEDYRFLPAGRILAGAGTGRQVTLFNCFVMGRIARVLSLLDSRDPGSDINRLNACGHIHPMRLHPWVYELIEQTLLLGDRTKGAFDVAAEPSRIGLRFIPHLQAKPGQEAASFRDVCLLGHNRVRFRISSTPNLKSCSTT